MQGHSRDSTINALFDIMVRFLPKINMTKRKHAKQSSKKHKAVHTKKRTHKRESVSGWEIVPFVVAVVVAIVVILQSVDSAKESRNGGDDMGAIRTHMAAGCDIEGGKLREVRGRERALARSIELLAEAQYQYDWDCSSEPNGILCAHARDNLQKVSILLQEQSIELEKTRMEACL